MTTSTVNSGYRSGIFSYASSKGYTVAANRQIIGCGDTDGYVVNANHEVIGYDLRVQSTSFVPPAVPFLKEKRIPSAAEPGVTRYNLDETERRVVSLQIAAETLHRAEQMTETATSVDDAIQRLRTAQAALEADAEKTNSKSPYCSWIVDLNRPVEGYNFTDQSRFVPLTIPRVNSLNVSSGTPHYLIDEKHRRKISVLAAAETLKRAERMIETAKTMTEVIQLFRDTQAELIAAAEKK